jgi:dihydrofolate reductase
VCVQLAAVRLDEHAEGLLVAAAGRLEQPQAPRRAARGVRAHPTRLRVAMSFALGGGSTGQKESPRRIRGAHLMSRKVIATFFVSLDGVVEAPQEWHFPYFNDEMQAAIGAAMGSADAMLCGRVTYQEWAAFWPDADNEMAEYMNNIRKYVASTTLEKVEWNNSKLLEGDVPAAVAALKQHPGKDIVMSGSATLARSLLREDLVDELHLMIHPVVVGEGARLFKDSDKHALELVDSKTFGTGVVYATYKPAASPAGS